MLLEEILKNIDKAIDHYMTAAKISVDEDSASAERVRLKDLFLAYRGEDKNDTQVSSLLAVLKKVSENIEKIPDAKEKEKYESLNAFFKKIVHKYSPSSQSSLSTTSMMANIQPPKNNLNSSMMPTPSSSGYEQKHQVPSQRMFGMPSGGYNAQPRKVGYAASSMSRTSMASASSNASLALSTINGIKSTIVSASEAKNNLQNVIGPGRASLVGFCDREMRNLKKASTLTSDQQDLLVTIEKFAAAILVRVDVSLYSIFQYYKTSDGDKSESHKKFFTNLATEAQAKEKEYKDFGKEVTDALSSREIKAVKASVQQGKRIIFSSEQRLEEACKVEFDVQSNSNTNRM